MQSVGMESVNCLLMPLDGLHDGVVQVLDTSFAGKPLSLLLVKTASQFCVYLNQCPHQGRRLDYAPGQFLTKSGTIICAAHGASFNLDSGLCVQGPCRGESLLALPTELVDGKLQIDVSGVV